MSFKPGGAPTRARRSGPTAVCLSLLSLLPPAAIPGAPKLFPASAAGRQTAAAGGQADAAEGAPRLELNRPVERSLTGGETHFYRLALSKGDYLRVVADQRGVDLVLTLFAPDGKQQSEVDSPNGLWGQEAISHIADAPGWYVLRVSSLDKTAVPGRYEVTLKDLRQSTPPDLSRVAAERLLMQAHDLIDEGTTEALRKGVDKYGEAALLYRQAGDRADEAASFYYLATAYSSLREWANSLENCERALALAVLVGDTDLEATILGRMAAVSIAAHDNQKALDLYTRVLALRRARGDGEGVARTLNDIGWLYKIRRQYPRALEYFRNALDASRGSDDKQLVGTSLNNIALLHYDLGEYGEALSYFNQALQLKQGVGNGRGEATILQNLAITHLRLGEHQGAIDCANRALAIWRASRWKRGEALSLGALGWGYYSAGDYRKALDCLGRALTLFRSTGDLMEEAATLNLMAHAERDSGDLAGARSHIEAALGILESTRGRAGSRGLEPSYPIPVAQYYEFYVDLLMRLHQLHPAEGFDRRAFEANEQGYARGLIEDLTDSHVDVWRGADPALLQREQTLRQSLNDKSMRQVSLLSGRHTPDEAAAAAKEIEEVVAELQDIEAGLRARSPHYASLMQPAPLLLPQVQQAIDADATLLEYALCDGASYLWVVTRDSMKSFKLPGRAVIEGAAEGVYQLLRARDLRYPSAARKRAAVKKADEEYERAAAALSRILLGPVADSLADRRLLVVADGALNYIPFAALPDPARPPEPLIVNHEVVNLISSSTLTLLRRETAGRKPAPKMIAIIADPIFDRDDLRVSRRALGRPKEASPEEPPGRPRPRPASGFESDLWPAGPAGNDALFSRLLLSRQEAHDIASVAPPGQRMVALDFKASVSTVQNADLAQYRIVHFATHGLIDSDNPELSALVLSLFDEHGAPQNGFLRLYDLYNLNLPVELVVLSACQTALGKQVRGEGVIGLARGFVYAGTKRVVASLWQVDDASTAELMKVFYRGMLKEGQRPSAALRAAQLAIRKENLWRSPYYWAVFVMQGEYD